MISGTLLCGIPLLLKMQQWCMGVFLLLLNSTLPRYCCDIAGYSVSVTRINIYHWRFIWFMSLYPIVILLPSIRVHCALGPSSSVNRNHFLLRTQHLISYIKLIVSTIYSALGAYRRILVKVLNLLPPRLLSPKLCVRNITICGMVNEVELINIDLQQINCACEPIYRKHRLDAVEVSLSLNVRIASPMISWSSYLTARLHFPLVSSATHNSGGDVQILCQSIMITLSSSTRNYVPVSCYVLLRHVAPIDASLCRQVCEFIHTATSKNFRINRFDYRSAVQNNTLVSLQDVSFAAQEKKCFIHAECLLVTQTLLNLRKVSSA